MLKKLSLRQQVVRAGFTTVLIKAGYVLLQFGVGVLLARMLGPESLGVYAFTMALVQLLVVAAQFGFPASLVRTVAIAETEKRYGSTKAQIRSAVVIVAALSLLIMCTCTIWMIWTNRLFDAKSTSIGFGLLLVAPIALSATISGALRGLGHVVYSQIGDQLGRPFTLLVFLSTTLLVSGSLTPNTALLLHTIAAYIAVAIAGITLWHKLSMNHHSAKGKLEIRASLMAGYPFVLLAGAQVLTYQTDLMMLGFLTSKDQVGLYRVAVQIADGMGVALYALSVVIAPHIARLSSLQHVDRIQYVLQYSHRVGTLLMLPLGLGIAIFSKPLLQLFFGEEFTEASEALTILATGKIGYATVGFAGLALSMLGHARTAFQITVLGLVLNGSLNFLLIPLFGIKGAAIATAISDISLNAIGIWYIKKSLSINIFALGWRTAIKG